LNILAFDTSTENCSVALLAAGQRFDHEILAGQRHSDLLLPMIGDLLATAGLALTDLDGICYGAGPGSFTGLRIACGIAQGLALGANLPVVGISTLEALAQAAGSGPVIAALDARMGEIYHAAYVRQQEQWQCVSPPCVCLPQEAPALDGSGWTGIGTAFRTYPEILSARYAGQIETMQGEAYPQARDILTLALPRFERGEAEDAAAAAPVYIRNKVAKTIHEQKRGR
jgi:tRNA threonylcarbamoyladenosine biosynthesis protein TsaB